MFGGVLGDMGGYMIPTRALLAILLASAVASGLRRAHADAPAQDALDTPSTIDWRPWRAALDATGILPSECGEVFAEAFDISGAPPPGTVVERASGEAAREPFARLEAAGGIPFSDLHGGMRRVRARFEDGAWIPRGEAEVQMNRGYARVDLGRGAGL